MTLDEQREEIKKMYWKRRKEYCHRVRKRMALFTLAACSEDFTESPAFNRSASDLKPQDVPHDFGVTTQEPTEYKLLRKLCIDLLYSFMVKIS